LDSENVSDFPEIFTEFREKHFSLLWRGSRDGFGAGDFHRHCDGYANTLTVILDTKGNIFGGFTPVEWESAVKNKADSSLRSFLFTIRNPHGLTARRFALKNEYKDGAILCGPTTGPHFIDLAVYDNCNENNDNSAYAFGVRYVNNTGRSGMKFFAGSHYFRVKEIEVFEITA
jgi:hypothetical protein